MADNTVKLKHFVENLHKELNNFEQHWIKKQQTHKEDYPDKLEVWDWLEQLECYHELHGSLFQACLDSEAETSSLKI